MARTRLGYRPALDGVRGIAIATVIGRHAFDQPAGGIIGVDLFFVLSGFLITTLLLQERDRDGRVDIAGFYRRRALRLFPALFTMLALYAVVHRSTGDLIPITAGVFYAENIVSAWNLHAVPPTLDHLWSLAQEEQFYIVWPLVLLVALRARTRLAARFLLALLVATSIEQFVLVQHGASLIRVWKAPDVHAYGLIVGCLAGVAFARGILPRALTPVLGLAGAAGLAVYALAAFKLVTVYALPINTLVAGACVLPILAAAGNSGAVAQLLSFRPLVFLGRISYSLYVWHLPVFAAFGVTTSNAGTNAARELLAVAAATLFAIASYYCVERPFLRLKDRFREPERRTDARTEGVQAAPAVAA